MVMFCFCCLSSGILGSVSNVVFVSSLFGGLFGEDVSSVDLSLLLLLGLRSGGEYEPILDEAACGVKKLIVSVRLGEV